MSVNAIVLTGFGINCDNETQGALARAGASARRVHLNDVIADPALLSAAHAESAALIVLTVGAEEKALKAISHIKHNYPGIPVIARARDLEASGSR